MSTRVLTAKAQEKIDFAAAALGAAGHEVTSPEALNLIERYAMHEITFDEAKREILRVFPN